MWLFGKLALVTGGSGTIGRAIAERLVHHGATVVLTGRQMDRLQAVAAAIVTTQQIGSTTSSSTNEETPSSRIHCVPCDISKESSVVQLFATIDKLREKPLDLLINNAGINIPGETIDLSADDFEKVMQVNVTGSFLCGREAMKRMRKVEAVSTNSEEYGCTATTTYYGGRIINIGSLSAHSPRPDSCPYTTSKFALQGLTQSFALDGRPYGISVGIIHPGNVESDLLTEEMKRERRETEGFLSPEDVADCVITMACMPRTATVLEMTVLPTKQPLVGRG